MKRLALKPPIVSTEEAVSFKDKMLASGEYITYANIAATVSRGIATDAADVGSVLISDSVTVLVRVKKGTHDNDYGLKVLVSTSQADVLEDELVLPVWAFNP